MAQVFLTTMASFDHPIDSLKLIMAEMSDEQIQTMFMDASEESNFELMNNMIYISPGLVFITDVFHNILRYYNDTGDENYLRLANEFVSLGVDPNESNGYDIITNQELKKKFKKQ
ncbi:MAG: hypothetical protein ACKPKO_09140, partial [Candidatus Fonsibacter sp.]